MEKKECDIKITHLMRREIQTPVHIGVLQYNKVSKCNSFQYVCQFRSFLRYYISDHRILWAEFKI